MIGAAIWYFPQPADLWTGKISIEAAKALQAGKRTTRDHEYPRKVAARELFAANDTDLTADAIYALYRQKFGKFNLVTKEENRKLMQFQRAESFASPKGSYWKARIQLIDAQEMKLPIDTPRKSSRTLG